VNQRWEKSIDISKKDSMWLDAMDTVSESKNQDLAESLVYFFVDKKLPECFAACLFTCYELIRADVVLEVAWRFNLNDYAMPFLIQTIREYDDRVKATEGRLVDLQKSIAERDEHHKKQSAQVEQNHAMAAPLAIMPPPSMIMGGAPPIMAPPMMMGGFGAPPMQFPPQQMHPGFGGPAF